MKRSKKREMTNSTGSLTIAFAAVLAIGGNAVANAADKQVAELRDAKREVQQAANATKGTPRLRLIQEQVKLQELIDGLESGRSVRPSEIDQAIERSHQVPR